MSAERIRSNEKFIHENMETSGTFEELVSLVLENGGRTDEQVGLKSRSSNLSIYTYFRTATAGSILRVLLECLMPMKAFESRSVDRKSVASYVTGLSGAGLGLMKAAVRHFNQTCKLSAHENANL